MSSSNSLMNTVFSRTRVFALLVLGAMLFLGCDNDSIVAPDVEAPKQETLTAEEQAILTDAGVADVSAGKASFSISRAPVYTFADPFGHVMGESLVLRHANSVSMLLRASELPQGAAVTMWIVIFNAPENCTDNACSEDDLTNADARVDIMYADGKVIGKPSPTNASWRDSYYFGQRRVGDTDGSVVPALFGTPAHGLESALDAEVHLVLRTHGPVISGMEKEMVSTFSAGCAGFPEALGTSGPNACEDIQFTIHPPSN